MGKFEREECHDLTHILKKIVFIYFQREGKGGRKKGRETSFGCLPQLGLGCNPGMCPDQELNWRPFALQDNTQSTKPQQSGPDSRFKRLTLIAL